MNYSVLKKKLKEATKVHAHQTLWHRAESYEAIIHPHFLILAEPCFSDEMVTVIKPFFSNIPKVGEYAPCVPIRSIEDSSMKLDTVAKLLRLFSQDSIDVIDTKLSDERLRYIIAEYPEGAVYVCYDKKEMFPLVDGNLLRGVSLFKNAPLLVGTMQTSARKLQVDIMPVSAHKNEYLKELKK